jgi:uncharacterized membrane-anchored protein YhcB (DUF1043 family)
MAKEGKTILSFLAGAAVGVAVGYILATDKETRKQDLNKVKDTLSNLKDKFSKKEKEHAMEDDIYHA